MTSAEKAGLYRELAKMIAADFHLDRSLALLLQQRHAGPRHRFLEVVQSRLREGTSVAEAVAAAGRSQISPLEISMIEAGERSGRLAQAFGHLAHYFAAVESARRAAVQAMIYPLVLLHLAILLPAIPAAIAAPESGSPVLRAGFSLALLWIAILCGLSLWRLVVERAEVSAAADTALARVPFIGRARRHWALARFCQVFHAGLLAAMRISRAVSLAGEASQSGRLRLAAALAAESIESGETVSESLRRTQAFPAEFINSLATAEEVGTLDEEMARWTVVETDLATQAIGRAALWMPKIGYAVIALFVVYRILEMVAGYYGNLMQRIDG